jgi:hypothetical protein
MMHFYFQALSKSIKFNIFEEFFLWKAQGQYHVDPVEGASPNVSRFCVRRDYLDFGSLR